MNSKLTSLLAVLFSVQVACGATFTVSNNNDAGAGSLRQAIIDANALTDADQIDFTGPFSITLVTRLPDITQPVFINGPVVSGQPQIELNGTTNAVLGPGIMIAASAAGTTIKGLNIHGHSNQGILIAASSVTIIGCYIGTDIGGTLDRGNGGHGIETAAGLSNLIIGGSTADSSNIISGNAFHGIAISPNCNNVRIAGNRIGVGAGVVNGPPISNGQNGIRADATTGLIIGGSIPGERNIVCANIQAGLNISLCTSGLIANNNIGVGVDGASVLANLGHGIYLFNSSNVLIGGSYEAKNVISGNGGAGINIENTSNITIQYNYVGTDRSGLLDKGNTSHGIQLNGTNTGIVIGGSRYVHGNIVSCNNGSGISFEDGGTGVAQSHGTIIKGNLIGTDSTTTQDFGNFVIGVTVKSNNCIIGDTANDEGNVIVGTDLFCGILVANGNNNFIRGNYLGVGLTGFAIPNKQDGINISVENAGQNASSNFVEYNTIAYNQRHGVNVGLALNNFNNNNERFNTIRFNQIFCNIGKGIILNSTSNNAKAVPVIDFTTTTNAVINGTAASGDSIDLYEMIDCPDCENNPQGKRWIAAVQANLSGRWTYTHASPVPSSTRIVATATDAAGNTSQFSGCCVARAGNRIVPSNGTTICITTIFSLVYDNDVPTNGLAGDSVLLQSSLDKVTWIDVEAKQLASSLTFSNLSITDTTTYQFISFSGGSRNAAQCKDTSLTITINAVIPPVAGNASVSSPSICPANNVTVSLAGSSGNIQWQRSAAGAAFSNIAGATTTPFVESPTAVQSPVQYRAVVRRGVCPADTSDTASVAVVLLDPGTVLGPQKQCDVTSAELTLVNSLGTIQWQDSTAGGVWTNIPLATSSSLTYTASALVGVDYIRVIVSDPTFTCPAEISNVFTLVSDTCPDQFPIKIPNAMTPNNDGNNDVFYIENINFYPDNHLIIFNRWGNKVYEATGYLNDWSGKDLPDATYYYLLELGEDVNGLTLEKSKYEGNVTILK